MSCGLSLRDLAALPISDSMPSIFQVKRVFRETNKSLASWSI